MKVNKKFTIDGLIEFIPNIYGDSRGQFIETYNKDILKELGFDEDFKQDNQSISKGGVFRGIHLQLEPYAQGKLVRVAKGSAIDYAVDLRPGSPTFGEWEFVVLTAEKGNQFWVPPGFGHAFMALEDDTIFCYKCTEVYAPDHQVAILWNDPDLGIGASQLFTPELSEKDANALFFQEYVFQYIKTNSGIV